MKKLFLIRHAKSSHDDLKTKDIDRKLNNRGNEEAPIMGKFLQEQGVKPDLIFSSPAIRALETAKLFSKELNYPEAAILINSDLYSFNQSIIMSFILSINPSAETALLFSHNPTFYELANYFTQNKIPSMPTCCIVGIEFKTDKWGEVETSEKNLICYEFPKKTGVGPTKFLMK